MKVNSTKTRYIWLGQLLLYISDLDQCREVCPLYQIHSVRVHRHNLGVKYCLLVACLFVTYSQILLQYIH